MGRKSRKKREGALTPGEYIELRSTVGLVPAGRYRYEGQCANLANLSFKGGFFGTLAENLQKGGIVRLGRTPRTDLVPCAVVQKHYQHVMKGLLKSPAKVHGECEIRELDLEKCREALLLPVGTSAS